MHRSPVAQGVLVVVVLALVASACGSTASAPVATSTTSATSPNASLTPLSSPSPSPTAEPTSSPRPTPPRWAEPIAEPLPPSDIATSRLVPAGTQGGERHTVPAGANVLDQIVVTWSEGSELLQRAHGLAIWQRFPEAPAWSVVYSFTDKAGAGVLGVRAEFGDLTGDGHDDVLSLESLGGSGGCGMWRVIATQQGVTGQIYERQMCDTRVVIDRGALVLTEAVYAPDDPHCCPSKYRTTTLRWNGETWDVVSREVDQA